MDDSLSPELPSWPSSAPAQVLAQVAPALRRAGRLVLCHIVRTEGATPGKPGWRLLVTAEDAPVGNLGGGAFEAMVVEDARALLTGGEAGEEAGEVRREVREGHREVRRYYLTEEARRGRATGMVCGGLAEVALEVLEAPPVLVICGGGPVGQAVARGAHLAGFEVVVAEDRQDFRRPELFPPGTALVAVDRGYGGDFLAPWKRRTLHIAVVSRCWETDLAALAAVLRQAPPRLAYTGLLGSRRKVERVRRTLEERGLDVRALRLHGPIGLDLGAETPGELAVAIVAEVVRVHRRGVEPAGEEGDEARDEARNEAEDEVRRGPVSVAG